MSSRLDAAGHRLPEMLTLAGIALLAGWLRLRDLDLVEFKEDEAIAVDLARGVLDGELPTVGLTSSVGARNPPLLAYVTAIPLAVRDDPLAATAFVGLLGVAAVILTYVVLRPRFGALVALGAAALFATAPWAVLYGRKIWGQSLLPVASVVLLWAMFAVLERTRTRAVLLIPVLLCVAFQLNFSALALAIPAGLILLYRAREVHLRALAVGAGLGALLLAPWLGYQIANGFDDVLALVSGGDAPPRHAGPIEAVRESVRLLGIGDWEYVAADSMPSFVADVGHVWKPARGASVIAAALLVLGLVTCSIRVARGVHTRSRWPWVDLEPASASRALLLVWLGGIWLTYAVPATDQLYPHYLIVTFPVSFAVEGLALADLVALRRSLRHIATIGAVLVLVVVSASYVAFTLSFHHFLADAGGTAGDYGVVYRDKAELARVVRERGERVVDEPVIDFLVTGEMNLPPGDPPFVTVTDRLHNAPPVCAGPVRSFGPLDACFPVP